MTVPVVASATLHPAPPESYTVFMAGCNYKCLNCQNWTIAQFPDNGYQPRGFISAKELAKECVAQLDSPAAKLMGADRIFFSGGEPSIHLPYIEEVIAEARKKRFSHERLLKYVLESECRAKSENARILRRKRAHIPDPLEIETYPFGRQPKLDRKKIMSLYDGFDYMTKQRNIIWLGKTGCGKTGLATSFLLQALDRGYRGYFITFPELVTELFQALADRSEQKLLKRYASYDCLIIDELGYVEVEPAQVGQFFTLMQKRHKKKTTLLTSNLGFSEWGSFLHNKQLTAALISRLTEISYVINMKDCQNLRPTLEQEVPSHGIRS